MVEHGNFASQAESRLEEPAGHDVQPNEDVPQHQNISYVVRKKKYTLCPKKNVHFFICQITLSKINRF